MLKVSVAIRLVPLKGRIMNRSSRLTVVPLIIAVLSLASLPSFANSGTVPTKVTDVKVAADLLACLGIHPYPLAKNTPSSCRNVASASVALSKCMNLSSSALKASVSCHKVARTVQQAYKDIRATSVYLIYKLTTSQYPLVLKVNGAKYSSRGTTPISEGSVISNKDGSITVSKGVLVYVDTRPSASSEISVCVSEISEDGKTILSQRATDLGMPTANRSSCTKAY